MIDAINSAEPIIDNPENYDDLIVSIEANKNRLNLLIAVCDHPDYRHQIIQRYEAELTPEIDCYQVQLARGEPSLKSAIATVVEQNKLLQQKKQVVITVTGTEQLYFLRHGSERSEQEIFFGYLQWTREALRQFPFSIVLWITTQIEQKLSKQAPDFWSWRKGVFRFQSKRKQLISRNEFKPFRDLFKPQFSEVDEDEPYSLPIEDLKALIQDIEHQKGIDDASLATLYAQLGKIYKRRIEDGECEDYQTEITLAIEYFQKAINLQQKLNLEIELAESLNNLAELYDSQGRYNEAEALLQQALEMGQRLFQEDHPHIATSLNNLAHIYYSQGRYSQAEPLFQQALKMYQRLFEGDHPHVALSLNNLASLYDSQGRYSEAEPLYKNALEMTQRLFEGDHPNIAQSLNNLAHIYYSQERYSEAEPLLQQALEMRQRLFEGDHPYIAQGLNNLASFYDSQERYSEAEPLFQQALEMRQRLFKGDHPDVALYLNHLAGVYYSQERYSEAELLLQQALEMTQRLFKGDHPDVAQSLNNLAGVYLSQGRYSQAEPLYQQALEMMIATVGENHPYTQKVRQNLIGFLEKVIQENKTDQLSDDELIQSLVSQLQQPENSSE